MSDDDFEDEDEDDEEMTEEQILNSPYPPYFRLNCICPVCRQTYKEVTCKFPPGYQWQFRMLTCAVYMEDLDFIKFFQVRFPTNFRKFARNQCFVKLMIANKRLAFLEYLITNGKVNLVTLPNLFNSMTVDHQTFLFFYNRLLEKNPRELNKRDPKFCVTAAKRGALETLQFLCESGFAINRRVFEKTTTCSKCFIYLIKRFVNSLPLNIWVLSAAYQDNEVWDTLYLLKVPFTWTAYVVAVDLRNDKFLNYPHPKFNDENNNKVSAIRLKNLIRPNSYRQIVHLHYMPRPYPYLY